MAQRDNILHSFNQYKLLAPDAVKKCKIVRDEEKNGQIILLEKYNSRDFSNIINLINTLKTINYLKKMKSEHLENSLSIFVEKNELAKETHDKTLALFNSRLNKKKF